MDLIYREELLKGIEDAQKVIDKIPNGIVAEAAKTTINTIRKLVDALPAVQTCDDAVSRQAAIDAIDEWESGHTWDGWCYRYKAKAKEYHISAPSAVIEQLPAVQPQPEIIRCKECKHWRDSDGVYRRGVDAESKCPLNTTDVYAGTFYCGYAERRTDEQNS